jgi:hypothetical protein
MLRPELDRERIRAHVENTLMLVAALSPVIGYENAAHIAEDANGSGSTLREAALRSGKISTEQSDKIIVAKNMFGYGLAGAWLRVPRRFSETPRLPIYSITSSARASSVGGAVAYADPVIWRSSSIHLTAFQPFQFKSYGLVTFARDGFQFDGIDYSNVSPTELNDPLVLESAGHEGNRIPMYAEHLPK